jgi:hypothetical protein
MSYISEEWKFPRERYILVAAIDIVIRAGSWNIYCSTTYKRSITDPSCKKEDVRG